ncbi:MAG: class I SAM-dependent methyltransferase [Chlorobi bacterium]|nr:class I SAM-dependent methyltransferase [Chlorobiota bacterium]
MRMHSQKKWYEEWFDSKYYLQLYSHRNKIEAEACIDIIQRATQFHPTETDKVRVLDIACGPGRHAISLAKRGFDVTAVDLSTTLLHHAHSEAQKAEVPIKFLQLDMRSLDFNAKFDLAVQLFSSFGYFDTIEEDFAVIQGARQALRDIGYYAIDLINPLVLEKTLIAKSTRVVDGGVKVIEKRQIVDGRVKKQITIPLKKEKLKFQEVVRLYSPETIERLLREAGFLPTHWFGDYAGLPFDRERSRRMIIINKVV